MQSYKLRKTSETALFPIEHELRMLRQENDKSWTTLMAKVLSVILSGIGTTVLCQDNCIPALTQYIFDVILKKSIPIGWIIIIQTFLAVGIFVLLSLIFIKIINVRNDSKDNKKDDLERENLAEVFHKIILNNIITGKSFTKKARIKFTEMQKQIEEAGNENNQKGKENKEQVRETKRELCLYLSEAFYYFMIAERQIRNKNIIEIGTRAKYLEYLDEVGILTLTESLLMYEKSVGELKNLLEKLQGMDSSIWKENEFEVLSMINGISRIEEIKKSILDWKINLNNTVKAIQK